MLDTRMTPISTRPRRPQRGAAPAESRFASAPRRERTAREPAPREMPAAETVRRTLPSARSSRLGRSEMRLMGIATACTAVVCALLLLYLAAYARVTQLGIAQASARGHLHQAQLRNELLSAERNSLESPQRIVAAAAAEGMAPRGATPVNYISAQKSSMQKQNEGGKVASDWDQGNSSGGTTENSSAAASRGH